MSLLNIPIHITGLSDKSICEIVSSGSSGDLNKLNILLIFISYTYG
jgi:hypothetical protein